MSTVRDVVDDMQLATLLVALALAAVSILVLIGVLSGTALAVTIVATGAVIVAQLLRDIAAAA